jgi:hypothetical protein
VLTLSCICDHSNCLVHAVYFGTALCACLTPGGCPKHTPVTACTWQGCKAACIFAALWGPGCLRQSLPTSSVSADQASSRQPKQEQQVSVSAILFYLQSMRTRLSEQTAVEQQDLPCMSVCYAAVLVWGATQHSMCLTLREGNF